MDRIVLALELAGPRAAEVALPLEVIDERWGVTPYEPIARAGHARRRIMAYGLGESWRPRYQDEGGAAEAPCYPQSYPGDFCS